MPNPVKARKEPTVSFSIRCPVSLEAESVTVAQRLGVERNRFIVLAIAEKIAREKRRAERAAA